MDAWGVDVAMCGSQKGLMTPPGLAFVAANERAHAVHQKADLRTRYWDWTFRRGEAHYQKYGGTPPQHLLFGLRKALDMLFAEGLENAARRHALLAEATRQAVARWAEGQALAFNITEPSERANSTTTVLMPGRDPRPLLDYCRHRCGVVLGVGIGDLSGKAFRIAHMGHVNAPMLIGTLGAVEIGFKALGIPHGSGGVQAAVDYLGREVPA
jgi:alanine-glyoxylate transaminase/serine-glyoxylate transaminase/serine-pyruvate transaminase